MNYRVVSIPQFDKDIKRLAKKYPSVKVDLAALIKHLSENPVIGIPVFKNCYKIRISISSKGKGKSSGARVITYVLVQETTVMLLSIYDKSEKENIEDNEILDLINSIGF